MIRFRRVKVENMVEGKKENEKENPMKKIGD